MGFFHQTPLVVETLDLMIDMLAEQMQAVDFLLDFLIAAVHLLGHPLEIAHPGIQCLDIIHPGIQIIQPVEGIGDLIADLFKEEFSVVQLFRFFIKILNQQLEVFPFLPRQHDQFAELIGIKRTKGLILLVL